MSELKEKARQAGLEEDSLIPQSGKNKQSYRYLQKNISAAKDGSSTRPQSAMSMGSKFSGFSNDLPRDCDSQLSESIDEKMMRSSFYSTKSKFGGTAVTAILDTFSVDNILKLTDDQRNLLEKLRQHMRN